MFQMFNVWGSIKDTSEFNIPGIPHPEILLPGHPGGSTDLNEFLDWRGLLWDGAARAPL